MTTFDASGIKTNKHGVLLESIERYTRLMREKYPPTDKPNTPSSSPPTFDELADRELEMANKLIQKQELFQFFNGSHDIGACLAGDFGKTAQASAEYLFTMIREASDEAITDEKVMNQLGQFVLEDLTEKYPNTHGPGSIGDALNPEESDRGFEHDQDNAIESGDFLSAERDAAVAATFKASYNRSTGKNLDEEEADLEAAQRERVAASEKEWPDSDEGVPADAFTATFGESTPVPKQ